MKKKKNVVLDTSDLEKIKIPNPTTRSRRGPGRPASSPGSRRNPSLKKTPKKKLWRHYGQYGVGKPASENVRIYIGVVQFQRSAPWSTSTGREWQIFIIHVGQHVRSNDLESIIHEKLATLFPEWKNIAIKKMSEIEKLYL